MLLKCKKIDKKGDNMSNNLNEKSMKKLKEQIKQFEKAKENLWDNIYQKSFPISNQNIAENCKSIFDEVLRICKEDKITKIEEFDNKYPIFEWGLEEFIDSYSNFIDFSEETDKILLEQEINMLEETIKQFHLDKDTKHEYELMIIRDRYLIGDKKEAESQLDKWIKAHPTEGEGYEVKCNWELEKTKPDIEKIAKILDEAEDNGTYVPDEEIYETVIKYYKKIGNDEMVEYYEALLDFMDNDDSFDLEEEELFDEERQEIINAMIETANDKIKKNKTFEEYIAEKEEIKVMVFLALLLMTGTEEKVKEIQKDVKKYMLENREEILKQNIKYMPKYIIEIIKNTPNSGMIELDLKTSAMEDILEIQKYFLLKQFGMAFIGHKNKKITIVLPEIKKMKELIENKEVKEENKEFNEKMNVIIGMCELYGAIKAKQVYHILEKIYGKMDKTELAKHLLIICGALGVAGIELEQSTGRIQFIYHNMIDEKTAKDIIKTKKDIKEYSKEEYLKYSNPNFLQDTKGYKILEQEFNSRMFYGEDLFKKMIDVLMPYTVEVRLGEKSADEMLEMLLEQIRQMNAIGLGNVDVENVQKGFKKLNSELVKWK